MYDFLLINLIFLALTLFKATTEHTKSRKVNHESWSKLTRDGQQDPWQGPCHQHHGHQAFHHLGEDARVSVKNPEHVFNV